MDSREDRRETVKLGRIERATLETLSAGGGLTHRDAALLAAYPDLGARPETAGGARRWDERRARAEAALSRAVKSLEAKGLLVSERNQRTGRVLLRAPGSGGLPDWEELARAEEDLAAHCRLVARDWQRLATRAAARAARLRIERDDSGTEEERDIDLMAVAALESGNRR